jgi:hypothetical protein
MSLAKAVTNGLKDRKCKKITLRKCLPIPYVPEKDCVQEMVSAFKDQSLKTQISKGTECQVPILHSGMHKAFLIHVGSRLESIKEKGYFKAHKPANETYVEQHKLVKQVKATLAKLDETASEGAVSSKKSSKKPKKAAATASQPDPDLQAEYVSDIKKAKVATEKAKAKAELVAAVDMFQLYANLLYINTKYAWNKILYKQTQSNPYTDLQGCSKKGPRGCMRKSFDNWVIFHLLTTFPNNAAEQERYYNTNVLKPPQHLNVHQFVQCVEQLNSYIVQLPCWFYSPSAKPTTILMNTPFAEANLASHILWICPPTWQDHFNLHEKGMTPMYMHLLISFKAIEHICAQEKSNTQSNKKASNKSKKGNKRPGTESTTRVPKKVCFEKHCNLCKKHGGVYTTHNMKECHKYEKDRSEKSDFHAAKKGRKKPNPTKKSFVQLSKKLEKLEKAIMKQGAKSRKRCRDDSNSNSK